MIQLYAFPLSGNSRKVLLTLEEIGIDYQFEQINLMQGEQKRDAYLAINPNGKVPAVRDGELLLWESSAIMLYLAEKFPHSGLLPTDPLQRAKLYQWLTWQPGTYNPPLSALNAEMVFKPPGQQSPERIAELKATVEANNLIIDKQLGEKEYLLDTFSLADIVMLPHLSAAADRGCNLSTRIAVYLNRLQERESWQKVSTMAT